MLMKAMSSNSLILGKQLIKKLGYFIKGMVSKYHNVAYHQEKELLAIGALNGSIVVYTIAQNKRLKVLEGHKKMISAIAFNKDGTKIVSYCGEEGVLRVWKKNSGVLAAIFSKTIVIEIQKDKEKKQIPYNGKKEDTYPGIEFSKSEKQVILYLHQDEAYEFQF